LLRTDVKNLETYQAEMVKKRNRIAELPHTHPEIYKERLNNNGEYLEMETLYKRGKILNASHYNEMVEDGYSLDEA